MGSRLALQLQIVILFVSIALGGQDRLPEIHVTLNPKSRTISNVLDEITLQTGYYFTYNADLVPGKEKVRFGVNDQPLNNVLDQLFQEPSFAYRVIDRNIVIFLKNDRPPSPIVPDTDRSVLKGKVLDERSGKPLAYATIALFGTPQGSITNQTGDFSFKIPPDLSDPMLVVSFMGYKNTFVPVNYPADQDITIMLERETIPLQEVIIRYTEPVMLLREALKRIPSNYLQGRSTMTAFYRESVKRNDHCMVYSEAVLDVAKGPYKPDSPRDQVRIRKGRKVTDLSAQDTVIIKLRSGIYTSFSLDVIKNRPDFLSEDFLDKYDLEFTDMITYGNQLVYVISFRQKSYITDLMFGGRIYLDHEHLAILAADFEYNPDLIHKEPGLFQVSSSPNIRIRPIMAKYHVDYRNLDGVFHVSQVRAEVELKVRKSRQWIGARYRIAIEMAITDVNPDERLRISMSDRVKSNTVLSDLPFAFDPLFWGPHNTIEPEASLKESLQRIEHNLQEVSE